MPNNDVFSAAEAGVYLGGERKPLSYQTLANWRTAGSGPRFTRLNGRMIRYLRCDLDAWLAMQGRFGSTSGSPLPVNPVPGTKAAAA